MKQRPPLEPPSSGEPPLGAVPNTLVLKFAEGSRVRRNSDGLFYAVTTDDETDDARLERSGLARGDLKDALESVHALLRLHPDVTIEGLVPAGQESRLEEGRAEAEQGADLELADLNLYFAVGGLKDADAVSALVEELNRLPIVECAYIPVQGSPASVTTFVSSGQTWLGRAPNGIDAEYAWRLSGGTGAGVRVVDVEFSWELLHEDLPGRYFLMEQSPLGAINVDHGTAVLGMLCASHNDFGTRGIVPDADIGVSSWGRIGLWAVSIIAAALVLRRGDVMLLEMHLPGPTTSPGDVFVGTGPGYLPVEVDGASRDSILFAVHVLGIVVVEAAGNGGLHLDSHFGGVGDLFRDRAFDSGAIMVGAGAAPTRTALDLTNHGSRLDVHAWGEGVHTTGFGDASQAPDGNTRQRYAADFGGTSSASPMVAGAAAAIQGILRAAGRPPLDPLAMRALLVRTGTPQEAGDAATRRIGPMPDLRRALTSLGFGPAGLGHVLAVPDTGRVVANGLREPGARWAAWQPTAPVTVAPGSPVGVVSRRRDLLDAFVVGTQGRVLASSWGPARGWGAWRAVGTTQFPQRTVVAAVARTASHLDLFAVGADGRPYTTWWDEGAEWAQWRAIGAGRFPPGAPLSVISRSPNHLDVFAVGLDRRDEGRAYTSAWNSRQADWTPWTNVSEGIFQHHTRLSTVAWRADQVDVFAVGRDRRVYTTARMDGQATFSAWRRIGAEVFPELTTIPALARGTNGLDLFGVNAAGHMMTSRWEIASSSDWSPWRRIRGGVFPTTATPAAISSGPTRLDVFAVGLDGRMYASGWAGTAQDWSPWEPMDSQVFPLNTVVTATYR